MGNRLRYAIALIVSATATGAVASLVQTQINLAALIALGAPVTPTICVITTIEDLARFGPVMIAIAAAALLPAMAGAHRAVRLTPSNGRGAAFEGLVFASAGVAGLWAAFTVMGFVTPMPALIAATRSAGGLAAMCATGAIGGLAYLCTLHVPPGKAGGRRDAMLTAALLAVPALSFVMMAPDADPPVPRIDPRRYSVQTVATGLDRPWAIGFLPDGRVLVTEKPGRLLAIRPDGTREAVSLDGLPPLFAGGENGLLDIVPDAGFTRTGTIYLSMTYGRAGAIGLRLVRVRLAGDRIADVRILYQTPTKTSSSNNGGRIVVLPDATLVLSVGDGNDTREAAQDLSSPWGKLIRIDREGRPPRDNPFVDRGGTAARVYSIGHRNVQGLAVDPRDGSLLVSDHGPRGGDELARLRPGSNHGWPVVTSGIDYSYARVTPFRRLKRYDPPLVEWTPSIAPAGLTVYDDTLFPAWRGDLFVPALKERAVRRIIRRNGRIVGQQLLLSELGERIRDVQVAPDGSLLVLTDGARARLVRLLPATPDKTSLKQPVLSHGYEDA